MIKYTRLFFPAIVADPVVKELKAQFEMRQHGDLFCWDESPNLRNAAKRIVDDDEAMMMVTPTPLYDDVERED
jgi:hypothetical protein